ncbi:MAG: cell division protein ZapA [Hyphomonadaceae bacterium]
MHVTVKILGQDYAIDCAECDARRLEDLAAALESRLRNYGGDTEAKRRLVLTALGLMDEVQATNAALERSRREVERLTDMLVEAKIEAQTSPPGKSDAPDRGRVGALRVALGRA